jgi:hypothetical protein
MSHNGQAVEKGPLGPVAIDTMALYAEHTADGGVLGTGF